MHHWIRRSSLRLLVLAGAIALNCAGSGAPARLLKVFDADTILVSLPGGQEEKVRLLGVDAPEVQGYRDAEPGGEAAKALARSLLTGQALTLEADPTADQRDRYRRLLRYVRLGDGRDLGAELIAAGYARAYRRFSYMRKQAYLGLESEARSAGRGLWADGNTGP